MEDLSLGRNAALVPEFAVKDLLLVRTHDLYIYIQDGRKISAFIVTDYLCYKKPKSPYNFFPYLNI